MTDWEWNTPAAVRIEQAVAEARRTPTFRRGVRAVRAAAVAYVLAVMAVCGGKLVGIDSHTSIAVGGGVIVGVAIPLTAFGIILARRATWAHRPHDPDGRRHWAAEVAVRLECDALALWRAGR